MKIKIYKLFLGLIVFLYAITAIISTKDYALFNGDNAGHIVQADFFSKNSIFSWSDIGYAGYPLLFFYQPLAHIFLSLLFKLGNIFFLFRIISVILFLAIPISFYFSFRRMGFSKTESLISSICPLLISSFTGYGLEQNAFFGWGLFTQLFGTFIFPIAISQLYLSILYKGNKIFSALVLSILILSHSILGLIALIISVMIVSLKFSRKIISNFFKIGFLSFIALSFWIVPLLAYRQYVTGILKAEEYVYSFGMLKVLLAFFSGNILDSERMPFLTIGAILGLFFLVFALFKNKSDAKEKTREKFVFFGFLMSMILFSGGKFMVSLPLFSFIELHRFIYAVHFFSILLIAIFFSWIIERYDKKTKKAKQRTAIIISIILILFICFISNLYEAYKRQADINKENNIDEIKQVASFLKDYPDGRSFVYLPDYQPGISLFQYYSKKPVVNDFPMGSHISYAVSDLDNINLAEKNLLEKYNIRYIILNKTIKLPYPKSDFDALAVYFVNTSGFFDVNESCGNIINEYNSETQYHAIVSLNEDCDIHFSMSYFPLWSAYKKDAKAQTNLRVEDDNHMILIKAEKGDYEIVMRYKDIWYRKWLFAVGIVLIIFYAFLFRENK